MDEQINERVLLLGQYILKKRETIRKVAQIFGVSKSTVHKDLSERLKTLDQSLFESVKELLDYNKSVRHIRGGNSTKLKYLHKKET